MSEDTDRRRPAALLESLLDALLDDDDDDVKSPTGEELFGEIEDSDNADDSDAYAPEKSGSEDGVSVSSLDINNHCW